MFYENELRFLCDILKKCRLKFSFCSPDDSVYKVLDETSRLLYINEENIGLTVKDIVSDIDAYTIYRIVNPFKLEFLFFLLPQTNNETVMVIGPFLPEKVENRQVLELCEKKYITPDKQKLLNDYYSSVPVVDDADKIFLIIDSFAERIWGGVGTYKNIDISNKLAVTPQVLSMASPDNQEELLVNMRLMEERYAYENEIMLAVSLGNDRKVAHIMSELSKVTFEQRGSDPFSNHKYYAIVMNTLLRKAAQDGGVHPIYLDDMSSGFAKRIEQVSSTDAMRELMQTMLKSYCRLVRMHAGRQYSSIVQKTISLIDYDLSSNLTLSYLAKAQNISSGYLATIFKKETGKTVTEFITDRRVDHAIRLLSTTKLQVQTVALHCGIMDVQYFSKIFKKKTGKTPKEYRESVNN